MKTYLCPECGRELKRGEKCPECGKIAEGVDLLAEDMRKPRKSLAQGINDLLDVYDEAEKLVNSWM